jgi:hypothetical protein
MMSLRHWTCVKNKFILRFFLHSLLLKIAKEKRLGMEMKKQPLWIPNHVEIPWCFQKTILLNLSKYDFINVFISHKLWTYNVIYSILLLKIHSINSSKPYNMETFISTFAQNLIWHDSIRLLWNKVHKSCVASLFLNRSYTLINTLINITSHTCLQNEI